MAHPPPEAPGRAHPLRGGPPLSAPFRVQEDRLYDVSARGTAFTEGDAAEAAARLARLRWLFALGLGANGLTWTLAGLAFVLGGRAWGAGFGLLALATVPLLALPALIEALARHRARRRHRVRPREFGRG
ncbi:hypothetical protein G3576_25780 [Roseomonas stagni]|uniref:Uncharacterized protein n=1 Tax=Falsiroseomonas algicola TaxID=2716930 RepID=A0A6M1LTX8_9PROT|nr:hypothetical protein [Falsiroseomonas algicola]NGM23449.1 hypothetical protein [Falsiroseomonas algicola]